MPRDDDIGRGQDTCPAALYRDLVSPERVDRRGSGPPPPQVGHRVDAVIGRDHERGVLLSVTRGQPQLAVRGEVVAIAVVVEPQVVAVARPESTTSAFGKSATLIVWSGWWWLRKTWVTASGATPSDGERVEDEAASGDHPRIDDDQASPSRTRTTLLPTRSPV